jgi:hypothetical protein
MEETLVVVACLYQKGCSESASVYYKSRPALQEFVLKVENRAKATVGPTLLNYGAPILVFAAGGQGSLQVSKNVSIKVSKEFTDLTFKKDF